MGHIEGSQFKGKHSKVHKSKDKIRERVHEKPVRRSEYLYLIQMQTKRESKTKMATPASQNLYELIIKCYFRLNRIRLSVLVYFPFLVTFYFM